MIPNRINEANLEDGHFVRQLAWSLQQSVMEKEMWSVEVLSSCIAEAWLGEF